MKREYSDQEVEDLVRQVETNYERILQDNLVRSYNRFRIRSHYNVFNLLKNGWLDNFDAKGKIDGPGLVGIKGGIEAVNCKMDEFGSFYFLPCEAQGKLDGEEIISRVAYYYCGKNRMDRSMLMKELLADYRKKFREPQALHLDNSPDRPCDTVPPNSV